MKESLQPGLTFEFSFQVPESKTVPHLYRRVRPAGPGWEPVRRAAGIARTEATSDADNIPLALLGWVAGCITIWSSLFTVGTVLYGRWVQAAILLAIFIGSGLTLIYVTRRLWRSEPEVAVE